MSMTAPSDREVFLNEVREAIDAEMQRQDAYRTGDLHAPHRARHHSCPADRQPPHTRLHRLRVLRMVRTHRGDRVNLADIQRTQAQFIASSNTCPACYRPRTECQHGKDRQ